MPAVPAGPIDVAGFAWAGEADIARVDISIDHGETWQPARLTGERQRYTWRRFEHRFTPDRAASYLILSRATDSNGDVQPAVSHWNPSGYLWNVIPSVRVEIVPRGTSGAPPAPSAVSRVEFPPKLRQACVGCHEAEMIEGGDRPMLGFETLTYCPIDRRLVLADLLTDEELRWLNGYHAETRDKLLPLIDDPEVATWLKRATAPLS